jgi:hypothetical protein
VELGEAKGNGGRNLSVRQQAAVGIRVTRTTGCFRGMEGSMTDYRHTGRIDIYEKKPGGGNWLGWLVIVLVAMAIFGGGSCRPSAVETTQPGTYNTR